MGEWSRLLGEYGETLAIDYAIKKLFNWRGSSNLQFNCKYRSRHNKISHDIDFFGFYNCPLIHETQQNLFISVKNTQPDSPKSDFKKFAGALSESLNCFIADNKYAILTQGLEKSKKKNNLILFWLNHSSAENEDLIRKIGNINNELDFDFEQVYVIDNHTLHYIFQANEFVKSLYPNGKIEYFYPLTGINESIFGGRLYAGNIMPIQFVNSPIIPFRIIEGERKILVLTLNEKFEEDSLKRLTGLAQNMTSGWCHKIVLVFPDYRYQEHSFIKDSVMLKFAENNFADMIEVRSLHKSYRNFEKDESVNYVEIQEENVAFNIEKMLPYGDQMRQLLTQSYINKQDLQTLLSRRGIIVHKSLSKDELIPYLTTTLISPSEFEYLRNRQRSKSNAERITSDYLITDSNTDLSETLLSLTIPIEDIIKKINPDIELMSSQPFIYGANGEIKLRVETKHPQLTKDWALNNTNNHTEIIFKPSTNQGDSLKTRIDICGTSQESKNIGKEIIDFCENFLKKQGNLRHDVSLQKTYANEFDNRNRTKLLFSFMNIKKEENFYIKFRDIIHLEYSITDQKIQLPEDIKSLKDKVEQSILSGHNLQEIKYITESQYHEVLIFTQVVAIFNFKYGDLKGTFEVMYGFPDYKVNSDDKAEFEFKITSITPFIEKNLSKQENHDLELFLKDQFTEIKIKKIEEVQHKYGKQLALIN